MSKVIVITGANGGLGRALAQRFISDGDTVVLLGRSLNKVVEVARALGERAIALACEVTSPSSVKDAFARLAKSYPAIDVLINNAAIFQPSPLAEASDDLIVQGVMTNLAGPMLCARAAIPLIRSGGVIINVSSESIDVPFAHLIVYQSTKAGLERFSRGLHEELLEKGIRVTIVRAGQMMGEGPAPSMDPVAAARFFEASVKRGVNPMERGVTQYRSTTDVFRQVIDLPSDMHMDMVSFQARRNT